MCIVYMWMQQALSNRNGNSLLGTSMPCVGCQYRICRITGFGLCIPCKYVGSFLSSLVWLWASRRRALALFGRSFGFILDWSWVILALFCLASCWLAQHLGWSYMLDGLVQIAVRTGLTILFGQQFFFCVLVFMNNVVLLQIVHTHRTVANFCLPWPHSGSSRFTKLWGSWMFSMVHACFNALLQILFADFPHRSLRYLLVESYKRELVRVLYAF